MSKRYLHSHAEFNIVYNCEIKESTKLPTNTLSEEKKCSINNAILSRYHSNGGSVLCDSMDVNGEHYAVPNTPGIGNRLL